MLLSIWCNKGNREWDSAGSAFLRDMKGLRKWLENEGKAAGPVKMVSFGMMV